MIDSPKYSTFNEGSSFLQFLTLAVCDCLGGPWQVQKFETKLQSLSTRLNAETHRFFSGSNLAQYIHPKDWDKWDDNICVWHNDIFLCPLDQSTGLTCQSVEQDVDYLLHHEQCQTKKGSNKLCIARFNLFHWSFQAKWQSLLCKYASLEKPLIRLFNRCENRACQTGSY